MITSDSSSSVVVAQLGARMHYAVPVMFQQAGMLQHFYTDLWFDDLPKVAQKAIRMIPQQGLQRFTSRHHPDLPNEMVSAYTSEGIKYAWGLTRCDKREEETRLFLEMGTKFTQWVAHEIERKNLQPDLLYLFNTAALELLEHPIASSSLTIVEQTLVPRTTEREILESEYRKRGLDYPTDAYSIAYEHREYEEWLNADIILCGSRFVEQAVQELSDGKARTHVIPYGYTPPSDFTPSSESNPPETKDALQLLFVGNGGLRKGLPYLLEAISDLDDVHLNIIGHTQLPEELQANYADQQNVAWLNRVPRHEMKRHYQSADVFVLPSLCEGSATVVYEAMSFGLPIICTPNSGSVITDGKEGYLIPIQSAEAIREQIIKLRDDSQLRSTMGKHALSTASDYTVEKYQTRLVDFVRRETAEGRGQT